MSIILGIDPGSRITGYGVIRGDGQRYEYLGSGCVRVSPEQGLQRFHHIFIGIREVVMQFQPDEAAIEQIFMHKNANSALKLGHARGAAIVGLESIPTAEYSARQVKQSVVGYGAASKEQVQHMVCTLLKLSQTPQADAADALAIALCHAHSRVGMNTQIRIVGRRRGRVR